MKVRSISILGCGWLGLPLGAKLVQSGFSVNGSTTTKDKLPVLQQAGITPYLIQLQGEKILGDTPEFFDCDVFIIAVPPQLRRRPAGEYVHQMAAVADCMNLQTHVIFISSTSVYTDTNGWVTESDVQEDHPIRVAEKIFLDKSFEIKTVIRFAGLVGPGRHPGRFLAGKVTDGNAPVNMIHLEDCIGIIHSVINHRTGGVYNACADLHPTKADFYTLAAANSGLAKPVFENNGNSRFKLIDNKLLKRVINYTYVHPDPMRMPYTLV